MKTDSFKKIIGLISQYLLITIFILAAIGKMTEPTTSLEFIRSVFKLSDFASVVILVGIIILEVILSIGMLLFSNEKLPFYATGTVLIIFSVVVVYGLYIDLEALCGCFGSIIEASMINNESLIRNIILSGLAFLVPSLK